MQTAERRGSETVEVEEGRRVLAGATLATLSVDTARAAAAGAKRLGADAAAAELSDALRLLREGDTFVEWHCRTALGEAVVALVAARPRELRRTAIGALRALVDATIAVHRTRAEYYPDLPSPPELAHTSLDTEAWGSLEVAMWALRGVVPLLDKEKAEEEASTAENEEAALAEIVLRAAPHANRHVRQAAMALATALCERKGALRALLGAGFPDAVAAALSDPWAQVRFAAAQAARALLDATPGGEERGFLAPTLLAALFVSRHDAAEGVRLQAQVNWRRAVNLSGKALLAKHAAPVVAFLGTLSASYSHELRAAACNAAGELSAAVSQRAVKPHAESLVAVMLAGMEDSHWSVRLAACNAFHDFASAFPAIASSSSREHGSITKLLALVGDEISCVREASAAALGAWARAFPADVRDSVARPLLLARAQELLEQIREEPVPEGSTRDSVCSDAIRRAHFNATDVHTGQTALGCCSLEPSKPHGDHDDHHEHSAPWQRVIGGAHFAREVARLWPDETVAGTLLPLLDEAYRARYYVHYPATQAAILQQVPSILESLGERARPFLESLSVLAVPNQRK